MVSGGEQLNPREEGSDLQQSEIAQSPNLEIVPDDPLENGIRKAGSPEAYLAAIQEYEQDLWGQLEQLRKKHKQPKVPTSKFLNSPEAARILDELKPFERMRQQVQLRIEQQMASAPAPEADEALSDSEEVHENTERAIEPGVEEPVEDEPSAPAKKPYRSIRQPSRELFMEEVRDRGGARGAFKDYVGRIQFLENLRQPNDSPERQQSIDASIAYLKGKLQRVETILQKREEAKQKREALQAIKPPARDTQVDLHGADYDPATGRWTLSHDPEQQAAASSGRSRMENRLLQEWRQKKDAPAETPTSIATPETEAADAKPTAETGPTEPEASGDVPAVIPAEVAPVLSKNRRSRTQEDIARQELYASFDDESLELSQPDRLRERLGQKNLDRMVEFAVLEKSKRGSDKAEALAKEISKASGVAPRWIREILEATGQQVDEAARAQVAAKQRSNSRLKSFFKGSAKAAGHTGLAYVAGATVAGVAGPLAAVGAVQATRLGIAVGETVQEHQRIKKERQSIAKAILAGETIQLGNATINAREALQERVLEVVSATKRAEMVDRIFNPEKIQGYVRHEARLKSKIAGATNDQEKALAERDLESLQLGQEARLRNSQHDAAERVYNRLVNRLGIPEADAESIAALAAEEYRLEQERLVEEAKIQAESTSSKAEKIEKIMSFMRRGPGQKIRSGVTSAALAAAVFEKLPYVRTAYGVMAGAEFGAGLAQATEKRRYAGSLEKSQTEIADVLATPEDQLDPAQVMKVLNDARYVLREAKHLKQPAYEQAKLERQVNALEAHIVGLRLEPNQEFSKEYVAAGQTRQRMADKERSRHSKRRLLARAVGGTVGGVLAELGVRVRNGDAQAQTPAAQGLEVQPLSETTKGLEKHPLAPETPDKGLLKNSFSVDSTPDDLTAQPSSPEKPVSTAVPDSALIRKGEGIEHALRRQLEERGMSRAESGAEAHRIALREGLVREDGSEVRVRWDPEHRVSVVLTPDQHVQFVNADVITETGVKGNLYVQDSDGAVAPFHNAESWTGASAADQATSDVSGTETGSNLTGEPIGATSGQTPATELHPTTERAGTATDSASAVAVETLPETTEGEADYTLAEIRQLSDAELLDSYRNTREVSTAALKERWHEANSAMTKRLSHLELKTGKHLEGPSLLLEEARVLAAIKQVLNERNQVVPVGNNELSLDAIFVGNLRLALDRHLESAHDFVVKTIKEHGVKSAPAKEAVDHSEQWQQFAKLVTRKPAPQFSELLKQRYRWQ